jgi:hypothetical protein
VCKSELSITPLGDLVYCCEVFLKEILMVFSKDPEGILNPLVIFWKQLFDEFTALKYDVLKVKYQHNNYWLQENNQEGIQWFEVIQQIEACIEEMIVLKIFDVMVSVMNVEQIHGIATFLMDRGVKFGEIAHMIRSLFYENHIKAFVEAACLEDFQLSLESLAEEKKAGLVVLPECSYCGMGLNFYSYISKDCKHPVSIFCAVGVTKQPETYLCPKCPDEKKKSKLKSRRHHPQPTAGRAAERSQR